MAAVVLGACGGGGGGGAQAPAAPTATAPGVVQAAIVEGPVTGFGSVIVNGVRFDDSQARFVDDDGADRSRAELQLGSMVRIEGKADDDAGSGSASRVVLMPSLLGPVESVDAGAGSFVMLGQKVVVDARTNFAGVAGLGALVAGDAVRVHGLPAADGTFAATLVEKLQAGPPAFEIHAIVRSVDTAGRTLKVGALTVDYSAAAVSPAGAEPFVGAVVRVRAERPPAAGVLAAQRLKIHSVRGAYAAASGYVEIKGILDGAPDAGGNATVSGIPVALSGAKLEGAGALTAGQRLEVKGVEVDGVIQASRVQFEGSRSAATGAVNELLGAISNFESAARFSVNGVIVDASRAAFDNGNAGKLANGVYVEVKGSVSSGASGSVLAATRVEFKEQPKDEDKGSGHREYYGAIQNFVSVASFVVSGRQVDASAAKIEDGSVADLRDGVYVEVKGTLQGEKLIASEVEIKALRGAIVPAPKPAPTPTPAPTPRLLLRLHPRPRLHRHPRRHPRPHLRPHRRPHLRPHLRPHPRRHRHPRRAPPTASRSTPRPRRALRSHAQPATARRRTPRRARVPTARARSVPRSLPTAAAWAPLPASTRRRS